MHRLVEYEKSKQNLWAVSTIKSSISRLRTALKHTFLQPQKLLEELLGAGYDKYSIRTTFVVVSDYLEFVGSPNPYPEFFKSNAQVFRNAYQDKYTDLTWAEFEAEIAEAPEVIRLPLALLGYGGCRISELVTFDGATVLGKGSKRRQVHIPSRFKQGRVTIAEHVIRRVIKRTPHEYRKLAADFMMRNGIDIKTIQVLLGHSSIQTTQRYLRPLEKEKLEEKLDAIWSK